MMEWNLYGLALAKMPTPSEAVKMVEDAGFVVTKHHDLMALGKEIYGEQTQEWWMDLQASLWPALPTSHPAIRWTLTYVLYGLSYVGILDNNVAEASYLQCLGADGAGELGRLNAMTPQYAVLAIKPE